MKTIFVKPATIEKKWYLIDAEGKSLGRVAVEAARISQSMFLIRIWGIIV